MDNLTTVLRNQLYAPKAKPVMAKKATFDSANDDTENNTALSYELGAIAQQAVAVIHQWVETSDLDSGETMADRLLSLFVGIADANQDGELDDDEQVVIEAALNAAWDYLDSLGVDEKDISALLNDWDDSVANNVVDLVSSSLPEGDDLADKAMDNFAFGDDDQDAVFDATYAKRIVVRAGKKMRINKRISGTVRLSAKQKLAIRKMQHKAHSPKARARRLRSMKIRKNMSV